MKKIEVTIICKTYNHEKYVRQCLEGLVNQKTSFLYEAIVHDDASTDNTADIIKEYAKKYPEIIKPILQKENQYSKGINATEKYIMPIAKGRYIARIEGDDYWCNENKLQQQYDALENNKECSICVHKTQFCSEEGELLNRFFPSEKCGINKSGTISKKTIANIFLADISYPFHFSSYFYRREILEPKYNYKNWTKKGRDIHFLQSALLAGDFYYIDNIMSIRRRDVPGSWTLRQKSEGIEKKAKILKERMEENLRFNTYSNYKFDKQVMTGIMNSLPKLEEYKKGKAKEFLEKNEFDYKQVVKYSTKKNIIKLILLMLNRKIYVTLVKK